VNEYIEQLVLEKHQLRQQIEVLTRLISVLTEDAEGEVIAAVEDLRDAKPVLVEQLPTGSIQVVRP
jgi:hypothetical protein